MKLALLVGNSSLRAALWSPELAAPVVETWWGAWDAEEAAGFPSIARALAAGRPDEVLVASVRPDRLESILAALTVTELPVRVAGTDFPVPLRSAYAVPEEAGIDRLLNALAAHGAWPDANAAVLDFGTALSVSVVSAAGVFLGGLIGLGAPAAAAGLRCATPRLPPLELSAATGCIHASTSAAMNAGVYRQLLGGAQRIIDDLRRELAAPAVVVVTGGGASLFVERLRDVDAHDPDLTLKGLALAGRAAV